MDYTQAIQKINLHIHLTVSEKKKEENETVSKSDQTVAEATETAEKNAAEAALKNALKEAASKAGITDDLDDALNDALKNGEINTAAPGKWEYKATVDGKEKTFVFAYDKTTVTTQQTEASDAEKDQVKADNGKKIDDINKNTSTGSASVSGAVITWTESGKSAYEVIKNTEFAESPEIDLKNIPTDASKEDLEGGGTRYTYTDAAGKKYELIYTAPTDEQLNQIKAKLLADGMTEENIKKSIENGDFTYVSWKITSPTEKDGTVTEQITDDKANLSSGNVKIEDKGNGNYTITVNGNTYKNMTTSDGGRTYSVTYNTTVESITVKTKEVVKESSSTISVSDTNEQDAKKALEDKIAELQAGLEEGEYIEVNGERFDRHTEVETIIRAFTTAINYKNMSDADIVAMLKKQKEDADKEGKSYTGAGVKHNWDGSHSTTGSNPNYIGHLDLATDSDLKLKDGTTADAILLNTGDKKFKFEWNMDAEALVNKDKPDTQAKFSDSISYDEGKMNDGSGTGDLAHYEYERKYTGSWIAPDSNNYPHESAYYRLTGTIAYNSLEDGKEYGSKREAEQALAKWRAEHPDAEDYRPNVVALSKKDKWDREIIVYKAYTYESSLTAYGYMSKDSNTCVNSGYGNTGYGRAWAGGFDLRISGLTQVTKTESSAHGKNYYDYYADITKYKTVEQTSRPLANRLLDVIPGTKTVPTETTNTDTGSGLFGSYDQNHSETHNYEKPFTGAGTAEYTTYRTWADTTADWDGEFEKLTGAFGFNYTTTKDAKVTEASKKTGVKTDSSVKYHYSYVERQELDPITDVKTVTTPDDDDGDEIIDKKDHDSPVLPGTPELPPVQDAKPDAPVLPADPALPAVQDAHALPQTGVNWLAAIGLALSGMTLMITGAFASLLGKNAKH